MTTASPALDTGRAGEPLDDPTVAYYTQHTGPWLGLAARALFCQLGRYVNPDTGQCWPTQERLARDLDTSRQSVARLGDKLVAAGEILVEHLPGESGKRNIYTFTGGLRKGWVPDDKPDLDGRSIEQYYFEETIRLKAQMAELQQAFNRLLSTGEIPDDLPGVAFPTDVPNVTSEINKKEEEEEESIDSDYESSSSSSLNAQKTATLALEEPLSWCKENWINISKPVRPRGWDDIYQAARYYRGNPSNFEEDKLGLEAWLETRKPAPLEYRYGDGAAEDTGRPPLPDQDPEARALWERVLARIQEQLPRPTFETWLKNTEGIAQQGEDFLVGVGSQFVLEWLERRMFHAMEVNLEKEAGRPLTLRLSRMS